MRVDILASVCLKRGLLRHGLFLGLRARSLVDAKLVHEAGESRRGQEHASEFGEAGILLHQNTVLVLQVIILLGVLGNFSFELADVF